MLNSHWVRANLCLLGIPPWQEQFFTALKFSLHICRKELREDVFHPQPVSQNSGSRETGNVVGEGGVVERNVWSVFVQNIILLGFGVLCIVTLWVTVFAILLDE